MTRTLLISIIAVLANIITIILGLREIRSLKSKCKNLESQVAQMSNNLYHSSLEVINGNKIYQGIDSNQIEELILKIQHQQQEKFVQQEDFLRLVGVVQKIVDYINSALDKFIKRLS